MASRVRVYLGCSFDGFIAGDDDDLSFLMGDENPLEPAKEESDPGALEFNDFLTDIGAMLMGRRTYDIVTKMDFPWPYGELPVLVATHRPLDAVQPTVRAVSGGIESLIAEAREVAAGKDVYLDGGIMVRQALDAGLVDHMVLTMVPVVIGSGLSLFHGLEKRHKLEFLGTYRYRGRALQVHVRPLKSA